MASTMQRSERGVLNEQWVLSGEDSERLEINLFKDGRFTTESRYANDWYSSEQGTYYFNKRTGEVFITIDYGSLDWLQGYQDGKKDLPLYYSENYSDYQLYFKITENSDSAVIVDEYVNSYRGGFCSEIKIYDKAPVWWKESGQYYPLTPDKKHLRKVVFKRELK